MSDDGIFATKIIVCIIVIATYVDLIVLPWLIDHDIVMKVLVLGTVALSLFAMKVKHDATR